MKTAQEWATHCVRKYGYGVSKELVRSIQSDALKEANNICIQKGEHISAKAIRKLAFKVEQGKL